MNLEPNGNVNIIQDNDEMEGEGLSALAVSAASTGTLTKKSEESLSQLQLVQRPKRQRNGRIGVKSTSTAAAQDENNDVQGADAAADDKLDLSTTATKIANSRNDFTCIFCTKVCVSGHRLIECGHRTCLSCVWEKTRLPEPPHGYRSGASCVCGHQIRSPPSHICSNSNQQSRFEEKADSEAIRLHESMQDRVERNEYIVEQKRIASISTHFRAEYGFDNNIVSLPYPYSSSYW
jgi:hypothetical protein